MLVDIADFAGECFDINRMFREDLCVLRRLHGDFRNSHIPEQLLVLGDNVVLHLLEKTDECFALSDSPFALQDCHEHVDALFGEGERKKF